MSTFDRPLTLLARNLLAALALAMTGACASIGAHGSGPAHAVADVSSGGGSSSESTRRTAGAQSIGQTAARIESRSASTFIHPHGPRGY
jgi:hypothetical protein